MQVAVFLLSGEHEHQIYLYSGHFTFFIQFYLCVLYIIKAKMIIIIYNSVLVTRDWTEAETQWSDDDRDAEELIWYT